MTQGNAGITGLAHIGIYTQNMERAKAFYQDVLGFALTNEEALVGAKGTTKLAFLEAGSCIVELVQPADPSSIADRPAGRVDHIAMSVKGIDEVAAKLKAKGVAFDTEEPGSLKILGGAKNIFFQGPDGERLELFEILA